MCIRDSIHTDGVRGGGTEKGSAMTAMPPNDRFDRFDRFSKLVPRFDHLKWKMAAAGILVGLISGFQMCIRDRATATFNALVLP